MSHELNGQIDRLCHAMGMEDAASEQFHESIRLIKTGPLGDLRDAEAFVGIVSTDHFFLGHDIEWFCKSILGWPAYKIETNPEICCCAVENEKARTAVQSKRARPRIKRPNESSEKYMNILRRSSAQISRKSLSCP